MQSVIMIYFILCLPTIFLLQLKQFRETNFISPIFFFRLFVLFLRFSLKINPGRNDKFPTKFIPYDNKSFEPLRVHENSFLKKNEIKCDKASTNLRFCHKCVCGINVCGIACENAHLTMKKRAIKKRKSLFALLFSFLLCAV